jgi:hypothetical protein
VRATAAARVPGLALALGTVLAFAPGRLAGQVADRVRDLELSGGVSVESYRGNLPAATIPLVDSTERAAAAVGEFGARGTIELVATDRRWLSFGFDGGVRQFAAGGFEVRDYAPREWVGRSSLSYGQPLGQWGAAAALLAWRGRRVDDRPPMPLFLQPAFGIVSGSLRVQLNPIQGVRFDGVADAEWADYAAQPLSNRLRLLDRDSRGLELGAAWGDVWIVRFHAGYRWSEFPHQLTFDFDDPVRRDRAVQAGFDWSLCGEGAACSLPITAEFGVEGTVNRSNSRRPEYDAVSIRTVLSVPMPLDVGATLIGVLTTKSYVNETDFKVLVPGEEADNASVVYLDLARPIAADLDASLRLGWTRAEADVRDSYFERLGVSVLLRYRPEF